nr:Ig-like domain-containing protein [Parageobacillus galactosidasius]
MVADVTKPTVTEFKFVDSKNIQITFSEDVTGADNRSNYKITDKDGKAVTDYTLSYNAEENKVTITFGSALKEGQQYNIEVSGVKDKAVVPNEMDKYTNTFVVPDTTAPTVSGTGVYDRTERTITVFFSEPVDGTSVLDKSKYTLTYGGNELPLPSDATISLGGNNASVTIKLPNIIKDKNGNDISSLIDGLIVGQVQDLAGNKSKVYNNVTLSGSASVIDATTVVADSAKTLDKRTIQFELGTPLKSISADDFTVNNKPVEYANFENKVVSDGTYGSVVTLQVGKDDAWNTDTKPAVAVKNVTTKTTSLYGGTLRANITLINGNSVKDGVAPEVKFNGDNPVIDVLDATGNGKADTIKITFTENLKAGSVSIEDFEVPGYTISDVQTDNNVVTLKLVEGGAADILETFNVKVVGDVADVAGNVLKGNANIIYTPVKAASMDLTSSDLLTTGLPAGSTLIDGNHEIGVTPLNMLAGAVTTNKLTVTGTMYQDDFTADLANEPGGNKAAFVNYIKTPTGTATVDLYKDGSYAWTATNQDNQWLDVTNGYVKVATYFAEKNASGTWVLRPNSVTTYKLVFKDNTGKVINTAEYVLDFSGVKIETTNRPQQP